MQMPFVKRFDGLGGMDDMDGMGWRWMALYGVAWMVAWLNNCVERADGTICLRVGWCVLKFSESSDDDRR